MDGLPKVSKIHIFNNLLLFPSNLYFLHLKDAIYKMQSQRSLPPPPLFLQSSPNNMGGMNNPPGTPRDDGEMGGNFLNPFQSESVSRASEWHLTTLNSYPWLHDKPVQECKQRVRLIFL